VPLYCDFLLCSTWQKQVKHRRDAHTCMLATRLLLFLPAPLLELPPRREASPPLESAAAAATDDDGAAAPNDVDETTAPSSATTSMRWVQSDAWVPEEVCGSVRASGSRKGTGWQKALSRARGGSGQAQFSGYN
jgi:hypothetical protein